MHSLRSLASHVLRVFTRHVQIRAARWLVAAARSLAPRSLVSDLWSLVFGLWSVVSADPVHAGADPAPTLVSSSGLRGEFFQFTNAIGIMPNLNGRTPDFAAVFPAVSFPNTSGAFQTADGFAPTNRLGKPFVTTFAARFTGSMNLAAAGEYEFDVSSDDGAILKLNGESVLDRNYLTGCSQSSTKLSLPAGSYPIELDFFQNYGGACLDFHVSGPGAVTFSPVAVSSPIEATIAAGFDMQVFSENIGFPTAITYLSGGTFGEGLLVGDTASSGGFGAVLKFDRAGSATVVSEAISSPQGFALSSSFAGALFVVDDYIPGSSFPAPGNRDAGTDHLKRLLPNGLLSDFAGFPGANRIAFGQGAFGSDLYVPDSYAQKISRVKSNGAISDFVTGKPYYALAVSAGGAFGNFIYAGEYGGGKIWKIAPDGTVTLFAGNISHPSGLALDPVGKFGGDLFVFSSAGDPLATNIARTIFRIKPDGSASQFATGLRARFGGDLAFGFDGDLFVLEDGRGRVLRVRPTAFSAPLMLLPAGTVEFGLVLAGRTNQVSMPLQNPGGSDLVVSGVTIDSPQFRWVAPSLPFTLPPGGQTNLIFQFAPTSLGAQTATATFQSNGAIAKTLSLSGRAEEREDFFIEAEDFNFGGGQHRAEADLMPYLGGAYAGLSAVAEVDYHDPSGNESAAYRPSDQKVPTTGSPDVDRGAYQMTVDYKVGWNDAGDWYNYTRKFPAAGADYHLFARLSSAGLANAIQLDQVTAGATATNQTLVKIGEARGPASGDWNKFLTVPVLDASGQLATVHLAGEQTLRVTILPGGNEDLNYLELVPATSMASTGCAAPPAGLVSWWVGEGNARDAAGTNAGTINGGVTFAAGEVGQAFHFNGKDASVKIPAAPSLNVGAGSGLTLEAWINPDDVTAQAPIVEWNNGSFGAHLWIFNGAGVLFANLVDTSGGYHIFSSANGILIAHVFQHIALTYDKATGQARLFRNGEIVAEQNLGKFNPQTSYDLYFGYRVGGRHFQGALDEISLFNRALTQQEISGIYLAGAAGKCAVSSAPQPQISGFTPGNGAVGSIITINGSNLTAVIAVSFGTIRSTNFTVNSSGSTITAVVPTGATTGPLAVTTPAGTAHSAAAFVVSAGESGQCAPAPAGLVGWWPGNGDANDRVSTNHGVLMNGATFAQGHVGLAFSFDGVDDRVAIPESPAINISQMPEWSMMAWIKPASFTEQSWPTIYSEGRWGASLGLNNPSGKLESWINNSNQADSTNAVPLNVWSHVALTYDGVERIFYINGEAAGIAPAPRVNPDTTGSSIGDVTSSPNSSRFHGLIDEMDLYNRALSAPEIKAIFNADSAGKCPPTNTNPPSVSGLRASSSSLDFGEVPVNTTKSRPLTLTNSGPAAVIISGISSNNSAFSFSSPAFPLTIPSGSAGLIMVFFSPVSSGVQTGAVSIATSDPNQPTLSIALSGAGTIIPPSIATVDPASGSPGSTVLLNGSGFSPVILSNQVTINGLTAAVLSATPTQLAVVLPSSLAPGQVKITVTVNGATSAPAKFAVAPMGGAILRVDRSDADATVSWPELAASAQLESTGSLEPPVIWTPVNTPPSSARGRKMVKLTPAEKKRFYRLRNAGIPGDSQQGGASTGHAMVSAAIGGTVTTEDQSATLVVPAGALAQDTDIQIASAHIPGAEEQTSSGNIFLSPEGLTFSKPVTLKVQLPRNPPDGYKLEVNLLSGENTRTQVGGEVSYFQSVTNYVFNPANAQLELPLNHFSLVTWWLDKMLYSVFQIPGKYLKKGDLIYALTGSNDGQGGTWRPGHCGLYLGTESAFADANDGDTIIESTTTHDLVFGEVRFDHLHSTGIRAFDNFNGEHIYLGARRPLNFDPTDNERTEIADWAIAHLHESYTIIGGGSFLAHDPPLLYEGFTCVGLTEQAYEFGAGKRIVPQIARVLPTPFYQFLFTRPVTVVEMGVGDSFDTKVYGVVNRGTILNDYYTSDEFYTRALNLEFSNDEARDAIATKRATFQSAAFGPNPPVYGLLSFTPAAGDAGKTFTFAFDIDATKSNAGKERAFLTVNVKPATTQAVFVRQDPPIIRVDSSNFGGDLVVKTNMAFVTTAGAQLPIKWDVPPAQVTSGQIITISLKPDTTGVPARVSWSNGDLSVAAPRRLYGDEGFGLYPDYLNYRGSDTDHAFIGYSLPGTACDSSRTCFDLGQRSVSPTFKVPDSGDGGFFITLHFEAYGGLTYGGSGYRGGNITWKYVSKP